MNDRKFLKVTYHLDSQKMNAYLKMPSPTYYVLRKEIEFCLFEERKQPRCEIRTFWIDEDKDEIEIINQCDYEIFLETSNERKHLQVAPIGVEKEQTKIPPAAGSYDKAVHKTVECDSCLMAPIIGFRYKCIQCPNYDLCENCESKHIHSEHMMVRMPTNNCPNVVEAYVTERSSGRRHGKRSKTSCPFVKNGLSEIIDDDAEAATSASCGENTEQQPSTPNGKERHHGRRYHRRQQRSNFFSHLYEMMHDLAEGGGTDAAAHAMGESATSSKSASFDKGSKNTSTSSSKGFENDGNPIAAAAAAAAAHIAAQQANDVASKAAEIAAKFAHETVLNASKNISENMTAAANSSTSAATPGNAEAEKEATTEKAEATTTPPESEPQGKTVPVIQSPSLETFVQILNNFSGMFAGMLDQFENSETGSNQSRSNLQKDSLSSNSNQLNSNMQKDSLSSNKSSLSSSSNQLHSNLQKDSNTSSLSSDLNSLDAEKKANEEKSMDKNPDQEQPKEKANVSDVSSNIEIDDLGSESENESVSDSFVKLNVPKNTENVSPSTETTPTQTLDKSKASDREESLKGNESTKETENKPHTTENEPENNTTSASTTDAPNKPEEKRAVPVYHADQRINNAVHAMMSMGFSNEGAWLTQLLESVNGNISQALDLMSAAQRYGSR